jgi:hypothetical protein
MLLKMQIWRLVKESEIQQQQHQQQVNSAEEVTKRYETTLDSGVNVCTILSVTCEMSFILLM